MSGAEALPQPGGLLIIKQLKLETFNLDGKLEITILPRSAFMTRSKGWRIRLDICSCGRVMERFSLKATVFCGGKASNYSPSQTMSAP